MNEGERGRNRMIPELLIKKFSGGLSLASSDLPHLTSSRWSRGFAG